MTDKTVAELMALARECGEIERRHCIGKAQWFDVRNAYAALEQAIRRAVDWELVATVVEPMHGNNGITWGREAHLNPPPVGARLYARNKP